MQINRISAAQSFGMDIKAPESFWATVNQEIWESPQSENSIKLLDSVDKIIHTPVSDCYEIEEIKQPIVKPFVIKKSNFPENIKKVPQNTYKENKTEISNITENFIKVGYKLVNKTKNIAVLEKIADLQAKLVSPADFVHHIAGNLKNLQQIEKQGKFI